MAADRKAGRRAGQPSPQPADVASRPGLANRGFGSLDPERQREIGGQTGPATPRGGTAPHEGGAAPREAARDRALRPTRRAAEQDRTKDPGGA